jgi:NAD(P) transhydrogenase subunit alpha
MLIGVPAETIAGESRVAATPETIKKLVKQGHQVRVQAGAGTGAHITDDALREAGAEVVDAAAAWGTEMVLKVRAPTAAEVGQMKAGTVLIGMLEPFDPAGLERLAGAQITGFALEAAPRTTCAQSMDVRSSQANIAGYKAVIIAADRYQKFFPMLMTAAGTVKAARVVILGVGVAGLQAIATAKRLGAVIEASDVRPSVKEQIESLGAKFIDVPYETAEEKEAAEGVGGYARPMPQSWLDRQNVEVAKRVAQADVVVSTALIPGRTAPVLITPEMVQSMKPGSVIIDMAAGQGAANADGTVGGNCPLTEAGKTVVKHGVTIVGETNLAALVATDASALYARNVLDFLKLVLPPAAKDQPPATFTIDPEDDIVAACLMTHQGALTHKK